MNHLSSKVGFITGGSKGIGFGIAEALMKEGINVAITGRTLTTIQEAANQLNNKFKASDVRAMGIKADVRYFESQERAIKLAVSEFGKIDILVANAGLGYFAPVGEIPFEKWQQLIDTNLSGPFYTLRAGLEQLKANKGYFFTISSLAGCNFFAGASLYNATKFGLTGFTQAAMLDIRQDGIKTSTIMPGSVATHFNNHEPDDKDAWKIQKEDIGQIVVDLLKMPARTLPSKVEVRPSKPPKK